MESKKINKILIAVSVVLGITFAGCFFYSLWNPKFSFVNTISAVSSFFVAVLTVIYVYTTSRQMDLMKQQLDQMQKDHRMSEQPILDLESLKFEIERPRFYYTPPEDKYSFLSRHHLSMQIHNVSSYPALFADVSAELIVKENGKRLFLGAASERINVIAANSVSNYIGIMFTGDSKQRIMSALRSYSTSGLPQVQITICYKSLSGASYMLKHTYLLDISEDNKTDIEIIKNWHATLASVPVAEKENLDRLKIASNEKERDRVFDTTKESFDKKLIGYTMLQISMIEVPQEFSLESISDEEFIRETEIHHYGSYIGSHTGACMCESEASSQ